MVLAIIKLPGWMDGNTSQLVIGPGHEINQLGWCFVGSPLSPYTILHNNMLRAALTGVVARSTAIRATPAFRAAAAPLGKLSNALPMTTNTRVINDPILI